MFEIYDEFLPLLEETGMKEFIQQITLNKESRSVVTAILSLAHGLRLDVVAEGVETAEQLRLLNAMRCTSAQ